MIGFRDKFSYGDNKDVVLKKDNKEIEIVYGKKLDLCFNIFGKSNDIQGGPFNKVIDFVIYNSDEEYKFFDQLINDIMSDEHVEKKDLVSDGIIHWYSDDTYLESADLLSIQREDGNIRLTFYNNPNELHFGIPVRIETYNSRYEPLNVHFMKMYNDMQKLYKDDECKLVKKNN